MSPSRLLFVNSFAFQEIYVRYRLLAFNSRTAQDGKNDPYLNESLLDLHMHDLRRFVRLGMEAGAAVAIVPFDIGMNAHAASRARYSRFLEATRRHGLPVWSLEGGFRDVPIEDLVVNRLDRHPNGLANKLAATFVSAQAVSMLDGRGSEDKELARRIP